MVMLWLFIVLVVIAAAAIIAVFIIDRRSSGDPTVRAPKRFRAPWSRRGEDEDRDDRRGGDDDKNDE